MLNVPIITNNMGTMIDNHFWCSFKINTNFAWVRWIFKSNQGSFSSWIKWTNTSNSSKFSLDKQVNWDSSILKESDQSFFSTTSDWNICSSIHFNSCISVVENTVLNSSNSIFFKITVFKSRSSGIFDFSIFNIKCSNFHISFC